MRNLKLGFTSPSGLLLPSVLIVAAERYQPHQFGPFRHTVIGAVSVLCVIVRQLGPLWKCVVNLPVGFAGPAV